MLQQITYSTNGWPSDQMQISLFEPKCLQYLVTVHSLLENAKRKPELLHQCMVAFFTIVWGVFDFGYGNEIGL